MGVLMKQVIFLICLGILAGCSSTQNNESYQQPVLIQQTRFPVLPQSVISSEIKLKVNLLIDEKGSVVDAKFEEGIGNEQWETAAIDSIKQWKYLPAKLNGNPIGAARTETIKIQAGNPIYMTLAIIEFDSQDIADSAYDLLKKGEDLQNIISQYFNENAQGREILKGNNVDIYRYPESISGSLANLKDNEFTEPLLYGRKFVIFMRLADSGSRNY
jgi:hypothetical protein